jgi:hypothetical protein
VVSSAVVLGRMIRLQVAASYEALRNPPLKRQLLQHLIIDHSATSASYPRDLGDFGPFDRILHIL